ncbi:MAG: bifunctional 4'-phosphopantothenoylcysteine decarboxylase/phosphopantothenoylcysteine synthetase, partial [Chromatiales bacterium]|nr:bifunctional 4'-phosphopantothenoylcysteine decarboxylase/phosphopantothenoylcysteine synthetase [Chromatiales bacterium]
LSAKSLDLIAANLVGEGRAFDKDTNALVAYWPEGSEDLGSGSKIELARLLLNLIARRFRAEDA